MDAIFTSKKKDNKELIIYYDSTSDSPRTWDNLFTIVGSPLQYDNCYDETQKVEEIREIVRRDGKISPKFLKDNIAYPIYAYDHGSVSFSTSEFSCRFDSGIIGYAYVSKDDVYKEYKVTRISKKLKENLEKLLKTEISTLNKWVNNEVYAFEIYDEKGELVDSCSGYYDLAQLHEDAQWEM